ncbi:tandem-95 repeat protein, partial [Acinetobacter sp. B51(2017)]|uniref:Ig-like domain-containing protein n=1 Tax=Acinetobacter sp. B51(2017) TaxID=2060938 RepID=UPI000F0927FE
PEQDAFDDVDSTEEDTPITLDVLANDAFEGTNPVITHVNGQPITEGNTVAVDNGDVTLTDGKLVFQPAPNYAGLVEFEYTAVTDEGVAETAQVNITVTPEDDGPAQPDPNKPTQGNDAGTGPEDTVITGDLDVVDPDGINNPNFTLNMPPQNGTVSIDPATGEWSYTPKPDWHGTDSFTVTVTDDQGFTTDIPVNVTVEPEQDAFDDVDSTEEDTPITLDVLANDAFEGTNPVITHVNGQPITEGNTVAVDNGDVTLTDGKLVFQPAPNYAGLVEFEYTAVTDEGVAETAQVNITVTAVNDAPVSEDDQIETPEDTPITGTVPATDPDGDDLTFVVGEPP